MGPLEEIIRTSSHCSDTINGWIWYCDAHDTHGNADSEDEAQQVSAAHERYFEVVICDNPDCQACEEPEAGSTHLGDPYAEGTCDIYVMRASGSGRSADPLTSHESKQVRDAMDTLMTEVLATPESRRAAAQEIYRTAKTIGHCRRCGREAILHPVYGTPTHRAEDAGGSIGCRAATWTRGGGWNDAIPRWWQLALDSQES